MTSERLLERMKLRILLSNAYGVMNRGLISQSAGALAEKLPNKCVSSVGLEWR
jgi:hypothetical protein